MRMKQLSAAALLATMLLGGCAWFEDTAVPVMTGETGEVLSPAVPIATLPHGGVTAFESTGTAAGEEAAALREELAAVQQSADSVFAIAQRAMADAAGDLGLYQQAAGAGQAAEAQGHLDSASSRVADMSAMAEEFSKASTYLDELRTRAQAAYNMDGVTEEDREQLSVLEGEINHTSAVIAQAYEELNAQITRHNEALTRVGQSGVTSITSTDLPITGPILPAPGLEAGARPFITIRFDNPNAAYQSEVATAMNQAMAQRPEAVFDVVAVTPDIGSAADVRSATRAAQRSADDVLRFVISLGVHPDRTTISSTTSDAVASNEVHIYIR
jgi:hypothetical protein